MDDIIDLLQGFAESPDSDGQLANRLSPLKLAIHALYQFSDFEPRLLAASALARLDGSEAFLPTLIEGLRSDDEAHRVYASFACRSLGENSAPLVPALIDVLSNHEHETARYHAIQAIQHIGERAIAAVPTLVKILRSVGNGCHGVEVLHALGAAVALGEIGDPAALPVLKECLNLATDGDELVEMLKEEAAVALRKISG